ncbi:MAG: hypothetical protein ACTHJ4_02350 [Candidatus Nucleicultricaceae bacterium]
MKSSLMIVASLGALVVAGCTSNPTSTCDRSTPNTPWSDNCEKHHSVISQDYEACMARVKKGKQHSDVAGKIYIDPKGSETAGQDENAPERSSDQN